MKNHGDPLGQAKPMIRTPGKVLPWWANFLTLAECSLATFVFLLAPFEAIMAQWPLKGLVLAVVGSIFVLGIDIVKLSKLKRVVPGSTPLSELTVAAHLCLFASKCVWVISLLTCFVVVLLTCLRFENYLIR